MLDRRAFLSLSVLTLFVAARPSRRPLPSRIRIALVDEPGQRLIITGRVLDSVGRAVAGATLYAWHTDAKGLYANGRRFYLRPRLAGTLETAADGSYAIDTIRPGPYPRGDIQAHIHFRVHAPRRWPFREAIFIDGRSQAIAKDFRLS